MTGPGGSTAGTVKALLLAAGLGTRLRPLTERLPKCLVPIGGRPLVEYWFDRLRDAGIREVLINTHHHASQVRAVIDRVNREGLLRVAESHEPILLGSAGTIHANREFAHDATDCVIAYADNLSDVDLGALLRCHRSHEDPITMMLFRATNPAQCGIATLDGGGRIVDFVEKPRNPSSDLANGGVYAVSATAYREIADMNASDLAYDVLPAFAGRMRGWVWGGYHRDVGTPAALAAAEREAAAVFGREQRAAP